MAGDPCAVCGLPTPRRPRPRFTATLVYRKTARGLRLLGTLCDREHTLDERVILHEVEFNSDPARDRIIANDARRDLIAAGIDPATGRRFTP